jgi:hypothetical protein
VARHVGAQGGNIGGCVRFEPDRHEW